MKRPGVRDRRSTGASSLPPPSDDEKREAGQADGFSDRLPTELLDLWQIGEETGELDSVTKRLADMYADKAELLLTEFTKWLPRLAYFFVCIIMVIQIFKGYGMIMRR